MFPSRPKSTYENPEELIEQTYVRAATPAFQYSELLPEDEIPSLVLFESLQQRWAHLLRSLTPQDFSRTYRHPEQGTVSLEEVVAIYAWHGRHHVAHIASLRERNGW
ncbi:MAG: DinB family protein [Candidatus Acidiferrales bacterium]